MRVLLITLFVGFISVSWHVSSMRQDGDRYDFMSNNPALVFSEALQIIEGIRCRDGFNNITDDVMDSAFYCADMKYTKMSNIHFSGEKANLEGPSPLLCLRTCVISQLGLTNENREGLNETSMNTFFRQELRNPGGVFASWIITKEIMTCDKRHNPLFPTVFHNCTNLQDFFRCTRRVMLDCSPDKKKKYRDEFLAYLKDHPNESQNEDD